MFLKQLELENFKSFGGKVTIPMMDGYMAVTGPNGSGKSNVTDAILFVLGPKSPKAVRAGRLTDLIFDGGKTKNPANFMKATLVFDNSDRVMPWDADDVRLTRYVKRTHGDDYSSYFYINDEKSTLTEFDSLLTKARISADGYNIVQQGDVTEIVKMSATERRRILDGVSGISSYDADLTRALREKAEAEINLTEIGLHLEELNKNLKRLEKEKADAKRYLDAKSALDMANVQLVHRRLQIEKDNQANLQRIIQSLNAEVEALTASKTDLTAKYEETLRAIAKKEAEIDAQLGPEYQELRNQAMDKRSDEATTKNLAEKAEDEIDEKTAYLLQTQENIANIGQQYIELQESISDLSIQKEDCEQKLKDAKEEDARINAEVSKNGGEMEALQEKINKLNADINALSDSEQNAKATYSSSKAADEAKQREVATLEEKVSEADFDEKDAKNNLEDIRKKYNGNNVEAISKRILELRNKEAKLESQERAVKDAREKVLEQYNQLKAEKSVSDRANAGSVAAREIIALRDKNEIKGIHGLVQELATVENGYDIALSVAAGGKMNAVVVDDDQVAAQCINYLKKNGYGRVTFLPLTKMMPGKPRSQAMIKVKQCKGFATEHINYDAKYANVFWYVFQDTLVCDDLDDARQLMGGVRIVTLSGELIESSGAMSGGTLSKQAVAKFGPSSQTELDNCAVKIKEYDNSLEVVRLDLRAVRDEIRIADDEMRRMGNADVQAKAELAAAEALLTQLKKIREEIAANLKVAREEAAKTASDLEKAKAEVFVVADKLQKAREQRDACNARMAEVAPVELQNRMTAVRNKIYELNNAVSDLTKQIVGIEGEMKGLDAQKAHYEKVVKETTDDIEEARKTVEEAGAKANKLHIEYLAIKAMIDEMEAGNNTLRNEKDALLQTKYSLDSDIKGIDERVDSKRHTLLTQDNAVKLSVEHLRDLEDEVAALGREPVLPLPSEEELKRTIRRCENELNSIGNVNTLAIDQYDECKSEYEEVGSKKARVEEQITQLDKTAENLNSQKKKLFMQSYDIVNANFKSIFKQLSDGGEAFMELEDPDDPFQGGLKINAKPKNGNLLRLEALSGGEKSLTALSFIFALQEYQPSPFYVLDEVDMFLDSVNAEKIAEKVKESSKRAQFIQISLRKVALAQAEHLIGVTRPPAGVSKIIVQPDFEEVSQYEKDNKPQMEE